MPLLLQVPPREWCPVKTTNPLLSRPSLSHPVSQARLECSGALARLDWSYTWADTADLTRHKYGGHWTLGHPPSHPHTLIPSHWRIVTNYCLGLNVLRVKTRPVKSWAGIVVAWPVLAVPSVENNVLHFRSLGISHSSIGCCSQSHQ